MTWLDDLTTAAQKQLDARVRDALAARGVSDAQIALYGIGYLDRVLPEAPYPQNFLEWSGHGQKLADVFVFPLTNTLGIIRGVQFRYVDRERHGYMDFIEGQDEAILFGLSQAMPHVWATRSVYLVEGVFDLCPVQRVFPGVLATLTARVTDPLLRILQRLVNRVWIGYDADDPGQRAAERFAKIHGRDFDARVIRYPRVPMVGTSKLTKDPGDIWETWGEEKFQAYLRPQVGPQTEMFDAQNLR